MPERVRVLQVIKGLGPGGAERLLVESAPALQEQGVDVGVVYALAYKDHLVPALEDAGAHVTGLGVQRLTDLRWLPRLVRTVRTVRPDVVHVHSPALAPVVRLAAALRVLGVRRPAVVTTEHNAWGTYHAVTRFANAATAWLDDATFAVSDEVRHSVRPGRLRRRVRALRHGIDTRAVRRHGARRGELRGEWGAGPDDVVVVTVANYRAQKNYPTLLHAAAEVLATEPRARFVAAGQGPLAAEIERLHRELELGTRFLLLGYRADAADVIAAADLFTLASDYEGLPVALMEALALGVPVVATGVGGVAETVDDTCGRLVPPGDPGALATALRDVIRDDALRRRLAVGAAAAGTRFDVGAAASVLATTYRDVSRRRPR